MKTRTTKAGPTIVLLAALVAAGCGGEKETTADDGSRAPEAKVALNKYATVPLVADLSGLSDSDRTAIRPLIEASIAMDRGFWRQVFGAREAFLATIPDPELRRFAEINYGPLDRIAGHRPFMAVQPRPATANFYPVDLQPNELDGAIAEAEDGGASLRDAYTVVRREEDRSLTTRSYHEEYSGAVTAAADAVARAAAATDDEALVGYLQALSEGLKNESFGDAEAAWFRTRKSSVNAIVGPFGLGEDHLRGVKRAFTGAVLARDEACTRRLGQALERVPELLADLDGIGRPAPPKGTVECRNLLYCGGSCNAGPKRITLEMPLPGDVRRKKGARTIHLPNVVRAKLEAVMLPIAREMLVDDPQESVAFEPFLLHSAYLEMARTGIGGETTRAVRETFGNRASVIEISRAGALALLLVDRAATSPSEKREAYVTFLAGAFRSLRYGAASAHSPASLMHLNHLLRAGAVERIGERYRIDPDAARQAMTELVTRLYAPIERESAPALVTFVNELLAGTDQLIADLDRLTAADVPVDVAFQQGAEVLGLGAP